MTDDTAPRAEEHTMTDTTTPTLLQAAQAAQEERIARVTEDRKRRDAREIAELRERAVDLTAEILGVETEPGDWSPHYDEPDTRLRGVVVGIDGVKLLASRDDRYRIELRAAGVDPDDGTLVACRFPIHNLADLPERIEEVDEILAELAALDETDDETDDDQDPSDEQTVDRLFSLEAARRAADNGDLVGAFLYLAGRVDLLVGLASEILRRGELHVDESTAAE